MNNYEFTCPEQKRIRLIIDTDAKNEADDQFAIVHHLLSEKMIVKYSAIANQTYNDVLERL